MNKSAAVIQFVNSFQLETQTVPTSADIAKRFPEMPDVAEVLRDCVQDEFLVTHALSYAVTMGGLYFVQLQSNQPPALDPVKIIAAQESNQYAQRRMFETRPDPATIRRAIWGDITD